MAHPRVDSMYWKEIEEARKDIHTLISQKNCVRDLLRLAYVSQFSIADYHRDTAETAATNDAAPKKNDNLKTLIEDIKTKHNTITYPDLYQLAGVVAVELLGGPKMEFLAGRENSTISPDERCIPDGKQGASDLRDAFKKVGLFDDKDIVALSGGLELATSPPTEKTLTFDNSYFVRLADKIPSLSDAPANDPLLDDPEFRKIVKVYAKDKDAFIKDYQVAHKKLSELGLPHSPFVRSTLEKSTFDSIVNNTTVAQKAVGVAVAAAVVIFSVFYIINRRRANKYSPNQFQ